MATTHSDPPAVAVRCAFCGHRIIRAATYTGRKLCFNAEPRPIIHAPHGWITGRFDGIGLAYAPLPLHPLQRRRSATHVMTLHACPRMTSGAAA